MMAGVATGELTVTGQVDQGQSANKGMRLDIAMTGYSDGPFVVDSHGDKIQIKYATGSTAPFLS